MIDNNLELIKVVQHKINHKTKPLGALGQLETLALQISSILGTENPLLINPHILVFAADHGIANEGVSAYPQEVTYQMVLNFLAGGAAINVFARQHDIQLKIIDAGVAHDFDAVPGLINQKIANGTASFLHQAALNSEQLEEGLEYGGKLVREIEAAGCNVIGFGEMGIGNTSSASMLMSYFCDLPLKECVGKGTGINDIQLQNKLNILEKSKIRVGEIDDPKEVLRQFGGFEIVQMAGAMMEAARNKMIILVDGFIATSAFLSACQMNPEVRKFGIFCHQSDESGHQKMLNYLDGDPILNLNLRLGEGTGCALAFPLLKSAVGFLNEMASFETAGVSEK